MTTTICPLTILLAYSVCGSAQSVSVARLMHKTPAKAWASFHHAAKLFDAGAAAQGRAEMEKAVALDPNFPEAHCNLGVAYMVMNRTEEAAAEFRRAVELDPGNAVSRTNLAVALTALGRQDEAEAEARTAIGLDSTYAQAHFLLGLLFQRHAVMRPFAERHLAYAGRRIPAALEALERLRQAEGVTAHAGR
jgi:Tfp pilus assembly protein PilF